MQYVVKVVWQSVTLACTLLLAPKSGHLLIQVKKKSLLFFLVEEQLSLFHSFTSQCNYKRFKVYV